MNTGPSSHAVSRSLNRDRVAVPFKPLRPSAGRDRVAFRGTDSCTEPASGHASSPFPNVRAPQPPSWQTGVPDPDCTAQTLGAPQQGESRQVTRLTPGR